MKWLQKINWIAWLLFVLALPVTSLPILAKVIHSSAVAPLSLFFAAVLAITWLPVYIKQRGSFPPQLKLLLFFIAAALITTFLAFFREVPAYKENSLLPAAIEGIFTLAIGFLFYIIISGLPRDEHWLQTTLKILNLGGLVVLVWSMIQLAYTFLTGGFPTWVYFVQFRLSSTTLFYHRSTGLASEPSWFAHQLNLVYLAYWLAATLRNYSAHRFRLFNKITVENGLLALGIISLVGTFSRVGIAAFGLVMAFLFFRANRKLIQRISQVWQNSTQKALFSILLSIGFIAVYLGILVGGVFILSKIDPRMQSVFDFSETGGLMKYAENLQFGERVVYWQTGWNIYNDHPILGVGLGMAGFYFQQKMPDYGWQLTETRRLLYSSSGLMNIKNFWARILAETGIVGFSLFLIFLIAEGVTAKRLTDSRSTIMQTLGWMGIFMLIAFTLEGFSVDSFALPYYWFTLGLINAGWIVERNNQERPVSKADHGQG